MDQLGKPLGRPDLETTEGDRKISDIHVLVASSVEHITS